MYLNAKYRSMYTLDILSKTLSFTLTTSSQVTLRLGVDVFYTGSGTSFSIPLPLKNGQVQEGAYVLNINGTETILSYKFPTEVPDVVWDVNGLLSTLSVSDNKTYSGTIISQSIECMPPAPLVAKTGLNKVGYAANIYSGDWSIIRKIKLSYDAGNGLNVINTIENTYTEIVLNINAKNLYQAVTNYIKSFVENCSPQREIAKFTKVNAYLQQYENYIELVDYENAYNSLVKAGELVGVDKTIQEIIPFTINENGGGCCDKEVVPAHAAYFGFSEVALMTDSIAKTLSIDKYNIYAHREWHMSQDGITSRFAYIVVPTSVAALIAMVKLKGGLLAVWESQLITIDGIPYTAIKSPNKFFDKDATFVTDALDDCDIALQWVNSNGSNVLTHIDNKNIHLTLEEKTQGSLSTGVAALPTIKHVASKVNSYDCIDIRDYGVDLTGVIDCTAKISTAISDAISTGKRKVYFASGTYNGGMNNKNSNIEFVMGADVKIMQTWHFAVGSSPLITPTSDPNYAPVDSYVDNVRIVGNITFVAPSGRLGCFMCRDCSVDYVKCTGDNRGVHIYFGTQRLTINSIHVASTMQNSGIVGSVFIDNIAGGSDAYRPSGITIGRVDIDYGYLSGVYINADGCSIGDLIVKNANNALVGDSHGVYIKKSNNVKIGNFSTHGCKGTNTYGIKIDQSSHVYASGESYGNQRGCTITSGSDNVYMSISSHDNEGNGIQLGGSGYINIMSANIRNNKGHGIFMTGVTGKVIIENCIVDGSGVVATYQNGIYYANSTGVLILDKAEIVNYSQTGGKGFYADTISGKTILTNILCHNNGEGFNINVNNCTGFLIDNIQAYSNSVRDFAPLPASTLKGLGVTV